jgi:hypothetical protein
MTEPFATIAVMPLTEADRVSIIETLVEELLKATS